MTANDKRLSRRLLGTFTALASDTCSNIGLQVIAHTSTKRVGKHHLYRNLREIGLDRWQSADWSLILAVLDGKPRLLPLLLGNGVGLVGNAVEHPNKKVSAGSPVLLGRGMTFVVEHEFLVY